MNRGSPWTSIRGPPSKGRFNEAPIHESGKFNTGYTIVDFLVMLQ